jgi:hypothetical protein
MLLRLVVCVEMLVVVVPGLVFLLRWLEVVVLRIRWGCNRIVTQVCVLFIVVRPQFIP